MAEENPIENEFEDNLENQTDIGLPDADTDDDLAIADSDEGQPDPEPQSSNLKQTFSNALNKLKENRRYKLLRGFIDRYYWGIIIFTLNKKPKVTPQAAAMVQQEAPTFDSSKIVRRNHPKKKEKIKYVDLYKQLDGRQVTPILRELVIKTLTTMLFKMVSNLIFKLILIKSLNKASISNKGLPSETVKGYEIFDEASNWWTEFDKRIRLIRALSGEMEKSIMEFDVDFAYVEIVIPETRLFAVTQPPVTSSILIKRKNGASINDETVYAIMQLVSNSVENLLPENISVVDTEGRVLSTGVIDRMTTKIKAEEKKAKPLPTTIGNGEVIIPVIGDVVDWFQLKFNYETVLEKAVNQLNGVLPSGSYKAAVTIDLNSVSKTGAPDIKQIVTSVVVDDQFDEVELNDETMEQVKQAVAGAVGYVEGRDIIHVSTASFYPKRTDRDPNFDSEKMNKVICLKILF